MRRAFANTGRSETHPVLSLPLHSIITRTEDDVLALCNIWKNCSFFFYDWMVTQLYKRKKIASMSIDAEVVCSFVPLGHFCVILMISHYNEPSGKGCSKWWEYCERFWVCVFFFYFLFLPFYEVFLEGNMGIYVIFLHQCVKAVLLFKKMYVLPFVLFILKRNKTDSIFEVHQVGVKTSDSHWETGKLHFFPPSY